VLAVCAAPAALAAALFCINGFHNTVLAFGAPSYALMGTAEPVQEVVVIEQATRLSVRATPGETVEELEEAWRASSYPRVLIYHTHATEAYCQDGNDTYVESGSWRTEDETKSVVAVGELLANLLEGDYGIPTIHDTTNHEPPKLSTSYSRSLLTMQAYQEQYPTIEYFIDVHRDAYGKTVTEPTDYVEIDGKQVARIMFVVGTGEGATGTGFDEMPDFDSNYAFASDITARLRTISGRLARDVRIKTGRYNQHVSAHCLLVEVGHNANTLAQALAAVPYLAEAIAQSMEQCEPCEPCGVAVTAWAP